MKFNSKMTDKYLYAVLTIVYKRSFISSCALPQVTEVRILSSYQFQLIWVKDNSYSYVEYIRSCVYFFITHNAIIIYCRFILPLIYLFLGRSTNLNIVIICCNIGVRWNDTFGLKKLMWYAHLGLDSKRRQ